VAQTLEVLLATAPVTRLECQLEQMVIDRPEGAVESRYSIERGSGIQG
jgi:hypothetical protein